MHQQQQSHQFLLQPATPYRWNDIQLALVSTTTPNFPILSNFFITDGNKTTIIDPTPAGQLLPYTAGQLQCNTREEAENFNNCIYAQSTCKCTTTVYDAACQCPQGTIHALLSDNSPTLPLARENVILLTDNNKVFAKTSSGTGISIQLNVDHMQIYTRRSANECHINASTIRGCYSCHKGATVDILCKSSFNEDTAEITCGNQTQLIICNPNGYITKAVFHFDHARIDANCT
ncbi:hypothetical protein OSTOST_13412, partial [Ostertagia ostertagi]